jgi:hypothetical protein
MFTVTIRYRLSEQFRKSEFIRTSAPVPEWQEHTGSVPGDIVTNLFEFNSDGRIFPCYGSPDPSHNLQYMSPPPFDGYQSFEQLLICCQNNRNFNLQKRREAEIAAIVNERVRARETALSAERARLDSLYAQFRDERAAFERRHTWALELLSQLKSGPPDESPSVAQPDED